MCFLVLLYHLILNIVDFDMVCITSYVINFILIDPISVEIQSDRS